MLVIHQAKICPDCKAPEKLPEEVIKKIAKDYPQVLEVKDFFRGTGCPKCNNSGYRGRLGTLETLLIDNEIKEMINKRKSEAVIREYLKSKGVKTLRDNAMTKFINGDTTLEEVLRVT